MKIRQVETFQPFPAIDNMNEKMKQNADGSYDIYYGPTAPKGMENNWLQTIPGKSFFTAIRMYGPLEPWLNKTWRPSEIELIEQN